MMSPAEAHERASGPGERNIPWAAPKGKDEMMEAVVHSSSAAYEYLSGLSPAEFRSFMDEAGSRRLHILTAKGERQEGWKTCLYVGATAAVLSCVGSGASGRMRLPPFRLKW